MTRLSLCLLIVSFSLPVIATAAEDDKEQRVWKDRERLTGRWRVVELVVNGKEAEELDAKKLTVFNEADGAWRLLSGGKEISAGTSTIDPTLNPKTIDFTIVEGEGKGNQHLGRYELGERTRKLVFAPPGKARPTEFSSTPGSGHVLVKFERIDDNERGGEQQSSTASADGDVFTNSDLLRINELLTDTYQFADNEFIYDERLKEAVEKASELAESPVNVVNVLVEVQHVGREALQVMFFPSAQGRPKAYPQVRFVEDRNADVQFYSRRADVGLGGTIISGQQAGRLNVGSVVPLPLAKTLRAGDRLKITGTLTEVKPVGMAANSNRKVAGFVIVISGTEKASQDDTEGKAAEAK